MQTGVLTFAPCKILASLFLFIGDYDYVLWTESGYTTFGDFGISTTML